VPLGPLQVGQDDAARGHQMAALQPACPERLFRVV
jgi:hypothetical protein